MPQQQASSETAPPGYEEVEQAPPGFEEVPSTGTRLPKGTMGQSINEPDSILGGIKRRAIATVEGMGKTLEQGPNEEERKRIEVTKPYSFERWKAIQQSGPAYRIAHGLYEAEKEAKTQSEEQFKEARESKGDLVDKALRYGRGVVTRLAAQNPFAVGSVTNINKLEAAGQPKEAIGQGIFDATTLLLGRRTGRTPTAETQAAKLSYAAGGEASAIEAALPELNKTVDITGAKPQGMTVGGYSDLVQQTLTRLDNKFNLGLQRVASDAIIPQEVTDALYERIRKLPRTAEGRAMRYEIRRAAVEYQRPRTLRDLNAERMLKSSKNKAFYNRTGTGQMAEMRSDVQTIIDKTVEDALKDTIYDYMESRMPGQGFRALKKSQSALLDLQDQLEKQIESLKDKQAAVKGDPTISGAVGNLRARFGVTVSPHGITPRIHGSEAAGRATMKSASKAVGQAFGPTPAAAAARQAILAMPITALGGKTPAVPPPPSSPEQ